MKNLSFITLYTFGVAAVASVFFGVKTTPSFLTGTGKQIVYDIGSILGGMLWPLVVALVIASIRYFYLAFKKRERNLLSAWMQVGTVTTTIFLLLVLQLSDTAHSQQQESGSVLTFNKIVNLDEYTCADFMKLPMLEGSSLVLFQLFYFAGEHQLSQINLSGDRPARIGQLFGEVCAIKEKAHVSLMEIFKEKESEILNLISL